MRNNYYNHGLQLKDGVHIAVGGDKFDMCRIFGLFDISNQLTDHLVLIALINHRSKRAYLILSDNDNHLVIANDDCIINYDGTINASTISSTDLHYVMGHYQRVYDDIDNDGGVLITDLDDYLNDY